METVRIGTRGSRLALIQAEMACRALEEAHTGIRTKLVVLHTKGDRILDKPLAEIGDKGLFVSEFEQAILDGRIDLAVHSAKDLPMQTAEGLTIGAVLKRADVRDVLAVKKEDGLPGAGKEFVLGTGSQRRGLLAQQRWEGIRLKQIRGNVESRLKKLAEGEYDGILLAKAGLDRLGIDALSHPEFSFYPLEPEAFLPAACQGIIALEAAGGSETAELLAAVSDRETELVFQVEREVLSLLQADCSEPAAAWCRREGSALLLDVMYGGVRASGTCFLPKRTGEGEADGENPAVLREALAMAAKTVDILKGAGK